MIALRDRTRLYQDLKDLRNNSFSLYNNETDSLLTISGDMGRMMRIMFNDQGRIKNPMLMLFPSVRRTIKELKKHDFIVRKTGEECRVFLLDDFDGVYPLTSVNIELVNYCNMNCIHCYGSFGQPKKKKSIGLKEFTDLVPDFNRLHTKSITLTGGECTLNKEFIEICQLILDNGFELWILTNGINKNRIKQLLSRTKKHINIKISLDGTEKIHDFIRNKQGAYKKTYDSIMFLSQKENVSLYISTVLMKSNLNDYEKFRNQNKELLSKVNYSVDIIMPSGNALFNFDECFSTDELNEIYNKYPSIFANKEKEDNNQRTKRCNAGINQCAIESDGKIKICNAACDELFAFSKNVFSVGLYNAWTLPGKNIEKYRVEKSKQTKDCRKCSIKEKCHSIDCRILAHLYRHDVERSSPIACFQSHKELERATDK